jgi:transcriptional regulator with XRE-family HTH domain
LKKFKKKINISSNIRKLRKSNYLSLKKLHELTGIEFNTLKKYEINIKMPSISNLILIAKFFDVTLDFLILWNMTNYLKSKKIISLARKIDKLDQYKRFQVESTANTLIRTAKQIDFSIKIDLKMDFLTVNLHNNLKLVREYKNISQKKIADILNTTQARISLYEKNQTPPPEKLILLSEIFNVSIHALATGEILDCNNFFNKGLKEAILKADQLLPLKDKQFLIHLMQRIIEDSNLKNS